SGGLAFDVILRPPIMENPPIVLMKNHSPSREISQEDINKKLKEAEDRRLALENQKLQSVQKSKERAAEANQRVQDLNESFIKEVEKKLNEKMEVSAEMKTQQIRILQEKLKEHEQHIRDIRQNKMMNQSMS
ncbi:hypothetical protein HELRODRAFT_81762, partial [Helobdella robusta]|uniref:Stathmin n=1 Tax=Helobdella robusta TaxID=6412 RepID=T1G4I5_HELRO